MEHSRKIHCPNFNTLVVSTLSVAEYEAIHPDISTSYLIIWLSLSSSVWREGYLLPTWLWLANVSTECSSCHQGEKWRSAMHYWGYTLLEVTLMTTGPFSLNVGKLFSELKLVTDNLLFIYAEANWEATESLAFHCLVGQGHGNEAKVLAYLQGTSQSTLS